MDKGDIIEGRVESLAFGGQGIIRTAGPVVFVPFTAPGDRLLCRITHVKKNYAEGEIVQLLEEGADRVKPRCPYYGVCGGCQLQHISYEGQLAYKEKAVADSLRRIGKIELPTHAPITPAVNIWGYRRHITLSLRPQGAAYEAGYTAVDGATLLPVKECPIFLEKDSSLFEALDFIVKRLKSSDDNPGRATILKAGDDAFLLLLRFKRLPSNCLEVFEEARANWPQWAGIIAEASGKKVCSGAKTTEAVIEGLTFSFGPSAFIQNHAEQSLNIYRDIVKLAKASGAKRILDLYCGIGISTLLLAGEANAIVGVEGNADAVALAKANAERNGIENAEFIVSDVKMGLKRRLKEHKPDLVVVNPPRDGLDKEVTATIEEMLPERVFYISCMPPTLARDIGQLCKGPYKVNSWSMYDMFPQTSHVETLVELVKR